MVFDIDGTLLDSVYVHVWSWRDAFRAHGVLVPTWRIHRAIGMGGDRLVTAVANAAVERSIGDQLRDRQAELYHEHADAIVPTPGATDLLESVKHRGLNVVLASSGSRDDTAAAIDRLEAHQYIDASVSGDDTGATKPDVEPVRRAVDAVDGVHAVVVGDSTWDMESARRAGHAAVGVLTGGIARHELIDAGADVVFDDPAALTAALDSVLFPA